MSSLQTHYAAVREGRTVSFRPRGGSMKGLVEDRDLVRVAPCRPELLEVGDVVLVRVHGSVYLHKVIAVDHARARVRIGNNRGGVNGWAGHDAVAGICTHIEDRPVRTATSKTR